MRPNFSIRNIAEGIVEVDIFGDIGDGWFSEGNTLQTVKDQINGAKPSHIDVNIDSLGGSVSDGFAIHDFLKTSPATVTAHIVGWTASAGTIIAMGADKIVSNENQMFLVHNAWTGLHGNAAELRSVADDLDRIDNKLVDIYERKTGMEPEAIRSLMGEERWMDVIEAQELGFIDEVNEPLKAAAKIDFDKINASHLPKINANYKPIQNEMEINEQSIAEKVLAGVKEYFTAQNKEVSEEALNAAAATQGTEIKAAFEASLTAAEGNINDLTAQVEALKAAAVTNEAEVNTLKADLDKAKAAGTKAVGAEAAPAEGSEAPVESEWINNLKNFVNKKIQTR